MIAVLDSNAVIGLAKAECLDQVRALFREVLIPPAVRHIDPDLVAGALALAGEAQPGKEGGPG
jgi:hypothetical protein